MDSLSLIAFGAAVGGGTGKFVEKAWDSGEKWIKSYFKNHKDIVQQRATENSLDFLTELANRIKILEDEKFISIEGIEVAQDHPEFSAILQKALLTSAQTDEKGKHQLLASLVSERLASEPQSTFSLSAKMACDAIAFMTQNQITLLALLIALDYMGPAPELGADRPTKEAEVNAWFEQHIKRFESFELGSQDLDHLESLSCLRNSSQVHRGMMPIRVINEVEIKYNDFSNPALGKKMGQLYFNLRQTGVQLTTTGKVIGYTAFSLMEGARPDFSEWK